MVSLGKKKSVKSVEKTEQRKNNGVRRERAFCLISK